MSSTALVFLLLPAFQGHRWRSFRVAAFCATGVSVLIPFVHAIAQFGFSNAMLQSGMPCYFAEAVLLLVGVVCFAVCLFSLLFYYTCLFFLGGKLM